MSRKLFCIAALLLVAQAGAAFAQTPGVGIEFEPYIGAYVPFTDAFNDEIGGVAVSAKQTEGFALGGRLLSKLGGAMGIEGKLGAYQFVAPGVNRKIFRKTVLGVQMSGG